MAKRIRRLLRNKMLSELCVSIVLAVFCYSRMPMNKNNDDEDNYDDDAY